MIISVVCFLKRPCEVFCLVFFVVPFFVKLKLKIFQTLPDVLGVKFFVWCFFVVPFFVKLKLKIFQTLPDVLGVKFFCLVFFVVPFFVELKLKFLRHCRTYSV